MPQLKKKSSFPLATATPCTAHLEEPPIQSHARVTCTVVLGLQRKRWDSGFGPGNTQARGRKQARYREPPDKRAGAIKR